MNASRHNALHEAVEAMLVHDCLRWELSDTETKAALSCALHNWMGRRAKPIGATLRLIFHKRTLYIVRVE